MPESASETSDYRKRIWNKDRKSWDGDVDAVEIIRRALWKSVYGLADKQRRGYTAAEVRAASLLVALEAMNYGSAELGFGNPYDQKRVEINTDKLFQNWIEMKTPKSMKIRETRQTSTR
jgi:hypothetical protein